MKLSRYTDIPPAPGLTELQQPSVSKLCGSFLLHIFMQEDRV